MDGLKRRTAIWRGRFLWHPDRWQAQGGLLRLSLEEVKHRFGEAGKTRKTKRSGGISTSTSELLNSGFVSEVPPLEHDALFFEPMPCGR